MERGQVEDVLQAFAIRLEHDRELRVPAGHLQQVLRLQALLPERCALSGTPAGDEERSRGVLAKTGAVQRRLRQLAEQEVLDLPGVEGEVGQRGRHVGVREVERDPVVRPQRLDVEAQRVAQACAQGHRPRRMHATAVGREDADAPVPDLVAEAFDDDRSVGRDDARRCLLLAKERDEVPRGQRVEAVVLLDPCDRSVVGESRQLTGRPADLLPELGGPSHALALPERSDARRARRRRHDDPVARYLHDPPRRCAEDERLALAGLVHHLLVQLPDAAAAVDEKDAEEPAVRDRPCIGDREPPRAGPTADRAGRAIPDDARSKLCEVVGGIAAREHVEDVLELRARQLGERVRAPHELVHLVDGELLVRADRDDLLREHVQRIPRDARLLDVAVAHRTCHHRRLEEVGPVLGKDPSLRDRIEVVSCPTDPLESTRDGLRALHLDHEVDSAHVDAELQR